VPEGVRRFGLIAAIAAIAALVLGGCGEQRHPVARQATTSGAAIAAPAAAGVSGPRGGLRTWLGPDGVQASWVWLENARSGTTGWRIPATAPTGIAGFADAVYAADGQQVSLFVSTVARSFRVEAYRMGYYGGAGGRLVWRSGWLPATVQPPCTRATGTNLVSCERWRPSLSQRLGPQFVQGDYLFKLVGSGGQQSYVPLTVWDPESRAAYLIKNDVLTWQAWNPFAGYDFYAGVGQCPAGVYPLCSRARIVSFDRPYAIGRGAGVFPTSELPLVQFMEQRGLDVAYATDLTVIEHPQVLLQHRALLSLGHDECWELGERRAAIEAQRHGVNIAFFGASAMLRHVRVQPSSLGRDREVVDYRDATADPLAGHGDPLQVTGNTWGSPPANWSADEFVGARYVGFLEPNAPAAPFVVADASAWIFAGTGACDGTAIPGVLASDIDGFNPDAHPADEQILGHSPVSVGAAEANVAWGSVTYSNMTYYTDPSSYAGVFDSGNNNWIAALTPCPRAQHVCAAGFVQRVTANLLHLLGQGPAGRTMPSRPDWQRLRPY
jgi:hypothetical protein